MAVGVATTGFANALLDHFRGGAAWTQPAGRFVALHTGDPGAAGTTANSAGSATRVSATYNAASGGAITLSNSPQWSNAGTSETISHISVWSAPTGGTFLYSAALSSSQPWASGNTFTLTTLGISVSPLAA